MSRRFLLAAALISLAACKKPAVPLTPDPAPWLDEEVDKLGKNSAPGANRDGDLFRGSAAAPGQGEKFSRKLDAGKCYHFAAVGDDNIQRMSLYLWGPSGWRAETERGKTARTTLTHCTEEAGMYEFEAKPTDGNGHFVVGIFSEDAPEPPPEPVEPVKAAPDMSGLIEKEAASVAAGAERVGDFFSDSSDKRDWPTQLEAGYCYWWIGAGEPGEIDELTLYLWDTTDSRITNSAASAASR